MKNGSVLLWVGLALLLGLGSGCGKEDQSVAGRVGKALATDAGLAARQIAASVVEEQDGRVVIGLKNLDEKIVGRLTDSQRVFVNQPAADGEEGLAAEERETAKIVAAALLKIKRMEGVEDVVVAPPEAEGGQDQDETLRQAMALFDTQAYAEAFPLFLRAADSGEPAAQFRVGLMYANGLGVDKDLAKAAEHYAAAAKRGNRDAQSNLGFLYANGQGVRQDYAAAAQWFRMAADQGDAVGQTNLGFLYKRGLGVQQDYAEAVKWLQAAAAQGDADGLNALAWLHATCREAAYLDGGKAVEAALNAAALRQNDWGVADTLAAAYARNGQFGMAIGEAERAVSLLDQDQALSEPERQEGRRAVTARLELYQAGRPFAEVE